MQEIFIEADLISAVEDESQRERERERERGQCWKMGILKNVNFSREKNIL